MAYVSQDRKAALAPAIKAVCKKYGIKATLSVYHHSTLCLNISSGKIDFFKHLAPSPYRRGDEGSVQVNVYHVESHWMDGEAKDFLKEVLVAMNAGNHDNSDIMTDYFDVGWYCEINVGKWNKPYVVG